MGQVNENCGFFRQLSDTADTACHVISIYNYPIRIIDNQSRYIVPHAFTSSRNAPRVFCLNFCRQHDRPATLFVKFKVHGRREYKMRPPAPASHFHSASPPWLQATMNTSKPNIYIYRSFNVQEQVSVEYKWARRTH